MKLIAKYERLEAPMMGPPGEHVTIELFLQGAEPWPADATAEESWARRGRLVDIVEPVAEHWTVTLVATLRALAPDDLDPERIALALQDRKQALCESPGEWIQHDSVRMRFDRTPFEREQDTIFDKLAQAAQTRLRLRKKSVDVRVDEIVLKNFRGLADRKLVFSRGNSTVFVGRNACGKTTLLDGVALLLSALVAGIAGQNTERRSLTDDDITHGRDSAKIAINARMGPRTEPRALAWDVGRARGNDRPVERSLRALTDAIGPMRDDLRPCLPVIAHYPVNRVVIGASPPNGRAILGDVYLGALTDRKPSFGVFFEWFLARDFIERDAQIDDEEYRDHQLEAVRRAVRAVISEFYNFSMQASDGRVLVTKGDAKLYVEQLSDGERCLIGMVGDLAQRFVIANPYADDPLQGGGVVLIDEIDLHLHVIWQERMIPALEATFPNCQFILTTHSPVVLGYVERDSVFILQPGPDGIEILHPHASKGADVDRILEDVLGGHARSAEFEDKLKYLNDLIDDRRPVEARAYLNELTKTLDRMDPALVRAELYLRRREAQAR